MKLRGCMNSRSWIPCYMPMMRSQGDILIIKILLFQDHGHWNRPNDKLLPFCGVLYLCIFDYICSSLESIGLHPKTYRSYSWSTNNIVIHSKEHGQTCQHVVKVWHHSTVSLPGIRRVEPHRVHQGHHCHRHLQRWTSRNSSVILRRFTS